MTSSLQIILIGLLIGLLVGVIIGYSLRQGRISELIQTLKQNQRRSEDLELDHQQRLQEATLRLQQDYEAQLAEKIERYQYQLEERTRELEQEYQTRLSVSEQGRQAAGSEFAEAATGGISAGPLPNISPEIQSVEQQVKRQYEDRLREAARKIQQAYEQHLRQKLRDARELLQQDYEQRLAQKIEHYETEATSRIEQLQSEYELRLQALGPTPPAPTAGWDTTVTMSAEQPQMVSATAPPLPTPSPAISDEALQRLESQLRQEYEQKLAEKIEHYQDDLAQRVQNLEAEYEARLQVSLQAQPEPLQPVEGALPSPEFTETPYREPELPAPADELAVLSGRVDDPALSGIPDLPVSGPVSESPAPPDEAFSLDDVLLSTDQTTGAEEDLNLDSDFDAQDFNLDELLFEQSQEEGSGSLPPDLDDISRLS
ncbi:MAG: hypothetical protein ICV62_07595 [Cyanobacteria bacterium Co-bin13]|nr:hypothetical protein [Cyanobacteria bacterium Co-bin13]